MKALHLCTFILGGLYAFDGRLSGRFYFGECLRFGERRGRRNFLWLPCLGGRCEDICMKLPGW